MNSLTKLSNLFSELRLNDITMKGQHQSFAQVYHPGCTREDYIKEILQHRLKYTQQPSTMSSYISATEVLKDYFTKLNSIAIKNGYNYLSYREHIDGDVDARFQELINTYQDCIGQHKKLLDCIAPQLSQNILLRISELRESGFEDIISTEILQGVEYIPDYVTREEKKYHAVNRHIKPSQIYIDDKSNNQALLVSSRIDASLYYSQRINQILFEDDIDPKIKKAIYMLLYKLDQITLEWYHAYAQIYLYMYSDSKAIRQMELNKKTNNLARQINPQPIWAYNQTLNALAIVSIYLEQIITEIYNYMISNKVVIIDEQVFNNELNNRSNDVPITFRSYLPTTQKLKNQTANINLPLNQEIV